MNLDEIALSLQPTPDKASNGHGYTAVYERFFEARRLEPLKLLEIGVWQGASLRLWCEYFPAAQVTGADIDIERCGPPPDRCRLWQADQSSSASLINMANHLGPWDIIIDDGSHFPPHQVNTLQTLWPYLNAGGLYCIEDLHTNYTVYANKPPRAVDVLGGHWQALLHGYGKTAFARWQNAPKAEQDALTDREKEIGAIHFYRYMAVIEKL